MAEVSSPLRPYARRFAIESTKIQILIGTESAGGLSMKSGFFIAEKKCHGIGRHRGTDNRSKERAEALPPLSRVLLARLF